MMASRVLEPEWLDELPPADNSAQQSRRDLRRLNRVLGHRRSMVRLLRMAGIEGRGRRLIDFGSGDGCFALNVVRSLRAEVELVLVDRQPSLAGTFARVEQVTADVFAFARELTRVPGTFVMANLFLHHFQSEQLRELFRLLVNKVDALAACEPPRSRGAMNAVRLLPLLGCNAVTRHDAIVSVRAGFRDRELSGLWSRDSGSDWNLWEGRCNLFTHGFAAWRK
jgi:hypothetical protein